MFESFYASAWHHPAMCWAVGFPLLAFFLIRALGGGPRARIAAGFALLQVAILVDAWMTGVHSPLAGSAARNAAIAFVVLGDARYFLLGLRLGRGTPLGRAVLLALAWGLVVPIVSLAVKLVSTTPRVLFLGYELMFAALAIVVATFAVPRLPEGPARTFAWRLTRFEIAQYLAWATADVIILAGFDGGYLLRLVPNLLYYVAFVPYAWSALPEEANS